MTVRQAITSETYVFVVITKSSRAAASLNRRTAHVQRLGARVISSISGWRGVKYRLVLPSAFMLILNSSPSFQFPSVSSHLLFFKNNCQTQLCTKFIQVCSTQYSTLTIFCLPPQLRFRPSPSTLIGGAFRIQLRVWGALWTPIQRVQTETGRQTVSGAFRVENQESCHGTIDTSAPKFRGRTVVYASSAFCPLEIAILRLMDGSSLCVFDGSDPSGARTAKTKSI